VYPPPTDKLSVSLKYTTGNDFLLTESSCATLCHNPACLTAPRSCISALYPVWCGEQQSLGSNTHTVQPRGHYMYRQFTAQWSLYVPPVYSPVVTTCTASLQPNGHYLYRQFTVQWSLYVPPVYSPVVTICTVNLTFTKSAFCPHSCIYVFCVDLRTNSDYVPIQH
jgi:hypothetical protein